MFLRDKILPVYFWFLFCQWYLINWECRFLFSLAIWLFFNLNTSSRVPFIYREPQVSSSISGQILPWLLAPCAVIRFVFYSLTLWLAPYHLRGLNVLLLSSVSLIAVTSVHLYQLTSLTSVNYLSYMCSNNHLGSLRYLCPTCLFSMVT